jgi:uncharacterized protein with NRDE domain
MCLIFISYKKHPDYPLVIAANRDEFYARPTAPANFWDQHPDVLAGIDLMHSGTWLGITKTGRFTFVTNFRNPKLAKARARSRGELTRDFLTGEENPGHYTRKVHNRRNQYNGFNLIAGDLTNLYYCASELEDVRALTPGNYGLSNGLLDSPWPKVIYGKQQFTECIRNQPDRDCLLAMLADQTKADVDKLPDTGIDKALEHTLSSRFISTPEYGTRSSTIIAVDKNNRVHFLEKTYPVAGKEGSVQEYWFNLQQTA